MGFALRLVGCAALIRSQARRAPEALGHCDNWSANYWRQRAGAWEPLCVQAPCALVVHEDCGEACMGIRPAGPLDSRMLLLVDLCDPDDLG